jgi:hypothetical protein
MLKWLFASSLCVCLVSGLAANRPAIAQAVDKPTDLWATRLHLPAFDRAFQNRVIDLSQMEVINSGSFSGVGNTCLHHDRWLRNLGYGDLAWSETTQQWIAFRGARLIALDQGDVDAAATISTSELKSRFEKQGSVVLSLDDAHCLAIRTAEGHLAVLKIDERNQRAVPSLDIDIHRLTTDEPFRNEQPNDRLAGAAWGPVVEGFQAGLAFRSPGPKDNWQRTVGESVPVKVFVRNASREAKTYTWQQFSEKDPQRKPPSRVPLLVAWRPHLTDSGGKPLPIAPPAELHLETVQQQATLQPGEWVLVGAAAIALWPMIDVGFGAASDRQTAVAVSLGDYRLSAEVDTGLVARPKLRTGTLSLSVIENQQRIDALQQLDSIASRHEQEREIGWQDAATKIRPAIGAATVDYLRLPCIVRDAQTKQPVAGATARVEIAAWGDRMFHKLCEYNLVTDAEGRFVMQIPQKLLSGFQEGCRADYRVHVTHPQYGEIFKSQTLASLQELGLIAKDGSVVKQGQQPGHADEGTLAEIQEIAIPAARTLSGRLLGKDGSPLHDVPIYCNDAMGFMVTVGSPKSDMEGRFRFNVPAKQTVKLEFRTAEFGRNYTTATGDQTDLGDIRAVEGMKVRGQIFDAAGIPIARIRANTPSFPDETAQPNFVYTTDANGWFTTDVLAPGEYQAVVGALKTSDSSGAELVGPPPDLYLPVRFKVQSGTPVADLTLRPAPATQVIVTLISSVPVTSADESPHVLDPLFWQVTMEKSNRERAKQISEGKEPPAFFFKGNLKEQHAMALGWILGFARIPSVVVNGKLSDQPWTRTPNFLELEPPTYSVKAPRDLTDVTFEPSNYVQHLQVGSGPKLFGRAIRIPKFDSDRFEMTIHRYQPTTLKVVFVDADSQQITLKEDALPDGLSVSAKYLREDEVRQAGGIFESSETLMSRAILDNTVLHFVLPGEEIELTVKSQSTPAVRRFTLKDGETRTVQIKLGPKLEWTESTKPTAKLESPR